MKTIKFIIVLSLLILSCEPDDPNEEGMHWNYKILCEDGFKWKVLSQRQGTIPLLDKNGKHIKCN